MSSAERLARLRTEGGIFPITGVARLLFAGPDAERSLNGQLSIDVKRLAANTSRRACLLNAKGKLVAPVRVRRLDSEFSIEVPAEIQQEATARLERYIIADDVTLTPEDTVPAWHVFGPAAPAEGVKSDRLGILGCDLPTPHEGLLTASPEELEILRIANGVPSWGRELTTDTLPQEARLEVEGVDFDKGCYVGQEVVSRLRSVGRVNSILHSFSSADRLAAPAALQTPSGESAGELTSAAWDFELAQTVALGYLRRTFETLPRFSVLDASGNVIGEVERREFPST